MFSFRRYTFVVLIAFTIPIVWYAVGSRVASSRVIAPAPSESGGTLFSRLRLGDIAALPSLTLPSEWVHLRRATAEWYRKRDDVRLSLSGVTHSAMLADWYFRDGIHSFGTAQLWLSYLLSPGSTDARSVFDRVPIVKTRYGLRYATRRTLYQTRALSRESHSAQTLACLADFCVPRETRIQLAEGYGSVGDVIEDALKTFQITDPEIEWFVVTACAYIPTGEVWEDRYGTRFSSADLAEAVLNRDLSTGCCAGTHVLRALFELWRSELRQPYLSQVLRARLKAQVGGMLATSLDRQLPDGSWTNDWHDQQSRNSTTNFAATSHLAELYAAILCDPDVAGSLGSEAKECLTELASIDRVSKALLRAATWLWLRLSTLRGFDSKNDADFCPAAHAITVLYALSNSGH